MRVILCDNYDEVSKAATKLVESQISLKPNCVLGLATGSTPVGMYKRLIEKCKKGELDFSEVTTFNLDEYYPISRDNDQSYYYFMNENLFSEININKENIHIPAYYQSADAFISASTTETQGLTYIEALSTGLIVLGRYDEVVQDIIIENENGFLFDDENELKNENDDKTKMEIAKQKM
mgnify:CR=1 FL=1